MQERWLITGAGGFCGRHLTHFLVTAGRAKVYGCGRTIPGHPLPGVEWSVCDVENGPSLRKLIEAVRPATVIHLAGAAGGVEPGALLQVNVTGTLNVLEACYAIPGLRPKVLLMGSSASFGEMVPEESRLGSERRPVPLCFHGMTREAALECGRVAALQWGLPIYLCRGFNAIGPGTLETFAPAAIARRLRKAVLEKAENFSLHNPEAIRDFIDVRDLAKALLAIIRSGRTGIPYSIGSGHGTSIRTLTEKLAAILGAKVEFKAAETEVRPGAAGPSRSVADITDLVADTGWKPEIPLDQSLRDMVAGMFPPGGSSAL